MKKKNHWSMRATRFAPAVAGVIAGMTGPAAAHAETIVSNLSDSQSSAAPLPQGIPLAQAFLTGNQAVTVQTITVDLTAGKGGLGDNTVSLYTNLSGSPGSLLGSSSAVNNMTGDVLFTLTSPLALSADTEYWVVLNNVNPGSGGNAVGTTTSSVQTSDVGATLQGDLENDGGTWQTVMFGGTTVEPALIDIEGTTQSASAVPEPGAFSLALLGSGLFAWVTRRMTGRAA